MLPNKLKAKAFGSCERDQVLFGFGFEAAAWSWVDIDTWHDVLFFGLEKESSRNQSNKVSNSSGGSRSTSSTPPPPRAPPSPFPLLRHARIPLRFNPLKPFMWLLFGIVTTIIAAIWIVHMVLFMIIQPAVTPFLNEYFLWFDKWFPLFGVLSVAIFSLYLLAACVKGCFKFGLRLVWFTLHPMKPNGTYMNSFLFNCGWVIL